MPGDNEREIAARHFNTVAGELDNVAIDQCT
jgi:hypothetical protein